MESLLQHSSVYLKKVNLTLGRGDQRVHVLHDVDLSIDAGEVVAIVGPSGAGKTSLIMVAAGLEPVTSGEVTVAGTAIFGMDENALARFRQEHIGIIFQQFYLIPTMTALENVMAPLEFGKDRSNARQQAEQALRDVGLGERITHYPSQLSGGEQQRVAIARAMVARPKLLLADEPTGNLDQETGEHIIELLFALQRQYGTTLIMITHDRELAARCSRILELRDGKLSTASEISSFKNLAAAQ